MDNKQNNKYKRKVTVDEFEDFLQTQYKKEVLEVLGKYPDEKSLIIDYNKLEEYNYEIADLLSDKPDEVIAVAEQAIKNIDPLMKDPKINVRFKNFGEEIPLKNLLSKYIGKFITTDGIVRKTDEIRPRIETAVFECRGCMRLHEVEQKSANHTIEPSLCSECGNSKSFRLIEEESTYIDTQTARMQEPLENLSSGTEPKQMIMIMEDDLVDQLNPGDKVRITGTLKTIRDERNKKFKTYIYVNHIEPLEQEFEELDLTPEDEAEILKLAKDPEIYDKIINSTAPSIKGYREVKEAIALQLFGGASKQLEDETKLRGDIHILIVGDPGIGKSQILKYVSKLAPRSIYTSGKGTSGAGLTAAAVRDELGGWSLEAGALVLGDQGNVCVDELDKMRPEDRSAIHEALEQQTVSIAKAGIMATLNSRCSVLAAANPKFGRFDRYKILADQIDLPAPIISRFDLIFVVEDKPDVVRDGELAEHILKTHQYSTVDYEIEPELFRKYIAYARKNVHPTLTNEATSILKDFYVKTRNSNPDDNSAVPITARQLEALVRLAEACAKLKLKDTVGKQEAEKAVELTKYCLKDVGVDPETGEMDADIVNGSKTPKSKRDKINIVSEEIKTLMNEYSDGQVPVNVLVDNLRENYEFAEKDTLDIVNTLRAKGVLFKPNNDCVKFS